jgi:hypothetical protein
LLVSYRGELEVPKPPANTDAYKSFLTGLQKRVDTRQHLLSRSLDQNLNALARLDIRERALRIVERYLAGDELLD